MPVFDMRDAVPMRRLSDDSLTTPSPFEAAQRPQTDELLRELISEVKALRADIKASKMLPDTPFVRRIVAEINGAE